MSRRALYCCHCNAEINRLTVSAPSLAPDSPTVTMAADRDSARRMGRKFCAIWSMRRICAEVGIRWVDGMTADWLTRSDAHLRC